jgi:hypothetical protein
MHNNRSQVALQAASASPTKAGWRVDEWTYATGLSRGSLYKLLKAGKVEAVKSGSATIVVTSPAKYLASLRREAA